MYFLYLIENPHLVVKYLVCLLAVWFFVLTVIGDLKDKLSSFIIFLFAFINIILFKEITLPYGSEAYLNAYIDERFVFVRLDGVAALALTTILWIDRTAEKQAYLLAFSTFAHTMVLYDLTKHSSWFSLFFYNHYDGLIIIVGILQIMVSYNGMVNGWDNSVRRVQGSLFWLRNSNNRNRKHLFARKKRES